jgi:hypothetical protein
MRSFPSIKNNGTKSRKRTGLAKGVAAEIIAVVEKTSRSLRREMVERIFS